MWVDGQTSDEEVAEQNGGVIGNSKLLRLQQLAPTEFLSEKAESRNVGSDCVTRLKVEAPGKRSNSSNKRSSL